MDFIALNNIKKDEEITFNYNSNPKNKRPLWFEVSPQINKISLVISLNLLKYTTLKMLNPQIKKWKVL